MALLKEEKPIMAESVDATFFGHLMAGKKNVDKIPYFNCYLKKDLRFESIHSKI